jgi:hypothetical protein
MARYDWINDKINDKISWFLDSAHPDENKFSGPDESQFTRTDENELLEDRPCSIVCKAGLTMWKFELQMRIFSCRWDTEILLCWLIAILAIRMLSQANKWWFWGVGDDWTVKIADFDDLNGFKLLLPGFQLASDRLVRQSAPTHVRPTSKRADGTPLQPPFLSFSFSFSSFPSFISSQQDHAVLPFHSNLPVSKISWLIGKLLQISRNLLVEPSAEDVIASPFG